MILMIDNYDSFTYNVVQYLAELNAEVKVIRNDELSVDEIIDLGADKIVVSPGPGNPDDAGVSLEVISRLGGAVPILGICLGHQSIGQAFGGRIVRAGQIMHGKISQMHHNGVGVFRNLPSPYPATRYHSLVLDKSQVPDCLEITAWTQTESGEMEEIMGIRHKDMAIEGVQFHPESILSDHGHALLQNFIDG
ncbi:anthranilate synthase component II [Halioxenophilus aromaticivorans]|uniref:Aminodeoxychorismate/anthranilate synthase component II n=1 Tax=Halioxenophilus aromaticivorans TaxID=1306992 RepID=A0AAV3U9J1_9ALTE